MSIRLEDAGGGTVPRVCLGGTKSRMSNVESLGCQMNMLNNWVDQSRGQVNASSMLNGGRTGDESRYLVV